MSGGARARRRDWREWALGAHAAGVFLFLYLPIVALVVFSFSASRFATQWGGFSLQWYGKLFANEALLGALANTLMLGAASTLIAGALGTLGALGLWRMSPRPRAALETMFYLPIVTPDIVLGLSLLLTFTLVLRLPLSLLTMTIAHVVFNTSYVMAVVSARLKGFDPRLEEAAADLGASAWQAFWRVKLPFIWPGILSGGLLALAMSLDEFTIAFFVSAPKSETLPIEIYGMLKRNFTPELNALATLMLAASVALATFSALILRRK